MKALPIVIGALVIVALVRVGVRRRRTSSTTPLPRLPRRRGDRRILGDVGLVAGREIRERLRGRLFRVVTLILFAVVAVAVIIPTLHSNSTSREVVGVVGVTTSVEVELRTLAIDADLPIVLIREPTVVAARAALSAGTLDVAVDGAGAILVDNPISAADTSSGARFVEAVAVELGAREAFAHAGLTPQQVAAVERARAWPIQSVRPEKAPRSTDETTALLGVILIFIILTQYLTWTLMGVMEEKASRVVEVLLATVRPVQLLAGKVAGIGVVALVQSMSLVAFALILAKIVGSSLVQGAAPLVVAATLVWLVLGYCFYSWLYAAAGSLAERQDQVQSLALPLSAPLIFGYVVSLTGVSSGSASLLVKVLAYIPPTAPFAMPTLVGFGDVTWWEFLLSVATSVVFTGVVALAAARIYRTAVLRTGGRVRLLDVVRNFSK